MKNSINASISLYLHHFWQRLQPSLLPALFSLFILSVPLKVEAEPFTENFETLSSSGDSTEVEYDPLVVHGFEFTSFYTPTGVENAVYVVEVADKFYGQKNNFVLRNTDWDSTMKITASDGEMFDLRQFDYQGIWSNGSMTIRGFDSDGVEIYNPVTVQYQAESNFSSVSLSWQGLASVEIAFDTYAFVDNFVLEKKENKFRSFSGDYYSAFNINHVIGYTVAVSSSFNLSWNFGLPYGSPTTGSSVVFTYPQQGTYQIQGMNCSTFPVCQDPTYRSVTIPGPTDFSPLISFNPPATGTVGDPVSFGIVEIKDYTGWPFYAYDRYGAGEAEYLVDFGDGTNISSTSVDMNWITDPLVHTYSQPGTYTATFTAKWAKGGPIAGDVLGTKSVTIQISGSTPPSGPPTPQEHVCTDPRPTVQTRKLDPVSGYLPGTNEWRDYSNPSSACIHPEVEKWIYKPGGILKK